MEIVFFIAMFFWPLLAALVGALALSSYLILLANPAPSPITPARLLKGYLLAVAAALLVSAVEADVPIEEAVRVFHVAPENYVTTVWNEYVLTAIVTIYVSLIGISIFGAPIAILLLRGGFGSVVWVSATSIPISLLVELLFLHRLLSLEALNIVGAHLTLACAFSIGLGLPFLRPRTAPSSRIPT